MATAHYPGPTVHLCAANVALSIGCCARPAPEQEQHKERPKGNSIIGISSASITIELGLPGPTVGTGMRSKFCTPGAAGPSPPLLRLLGLNCILREGEKTGELLPRHRIQSTTIIRESMDSPSEQTKVEK